MDPKRIFYFYFAFDSRDRFLSALLCVNELGYPYDFRYTSPVQPNPMQTALYGQGLETYLISTAAKELLKGLELRPDLVLCNSRLFVSETPILYWNKTENKTVGEPDAMAILPLLFEIEEPFQRIEQALALTPK